MARDLVNATIEGILDRAIDGTFVPGVALPKEVELASMFSVSRLTIREAVRVLTDRRVLNVIHGRGTYLIPQEDWIDLSTIAYVARAQMNSRDLGLELLQVRSFLEVGAARLAAIYRTESDLEKIKQCNARFYDADLHDDSDEAVRADIAFHAAIFSATRNKFMSAILTPLEEALVEARGEVAKNHVGRQRTYRHHVLIIDAIEAQNPDEAMEAMRNHLNQARADLAELTQVG